VRHRRAGAVATSSAQLPLTPNNRHSRRRLFRPLAYCEGPMVR
jgi:hypothetical protein